MGFRYLYNSLGDAETMTPSSTATGTDVDNVKNPVAAIYWQSVAGDVIDTIDIDFGANVDISASAVVGHDFVSGDTISLVGADDAAFTVNVQVIGQGGKTEKVCFTFGFTTYARRYWRLKIDKGADTTVRKVGRWMIGEWEETTFDAKDAGFQTGTAFTTSRTVRTEGGQLYGDIGEVLDRITATIPGIPLSEKESLLTMIWAISTAVPFVASFDNLDATERFDKVIYGTFDAIPIFTSASAPGLWETAFKISEQR